MIRNTLRRGFTLIELLVVIAIIGILASVVLGSLNSARDKGSDAAVKSNLNNARAQAELYYDNNKNYTLVCTGAGGVGQFVTGAQGAGETVSCADDATAWAVQSTIKAGGYYCVDSTGKSATTSSSSIADGSDYTCG